MKNKKKGFTLLETMEVLVIFGILALATSELLINNTVFVSQNNKQAIERFDYMHYTECIVLDVKESQNITVEVDKIILDSITYSVSGNQLFRNGTPLFSLSSHLFVKDANLIRINLGIVQGTKTNQSNLVIRR